MQGCYGEFQPVRDKICRHFINGVCFKADQCRFSHPHNRQFRSTPDCRNGRGCAYLARGTCRYFHRGVGVQQSGYKQQNNQTFKLLNRKTISRNNWSVVQILEDCRKVPYCSFIHYEEDFPKLSNANNPPIRPKASGWEDH